MYAQSTQQQAGTGPGAGAGADAGAQTGGGKKDDDVVDADFEEVK
jgi:molecular chaperone DnaK